jgi:hypothetical protein
LFGKGYDGEDGELLLRQWCGVVFIVVATGVIGVFMALSSMRCRS